MNSKIESLIRKAETGADWAEICRLEAEMVEECHHTDGLYSDDRCKNCGAIIETRPYVMSRDK